MDNGAIHLNGFDEQDPHATAGLTCDIELEAVGGLTPREVAGRIAAALRSLATQIETGLLESGHHPIDDAAGEIGTVYLDFFGEG
ncbi:hypothetical protein [Rhizobium sp. 007]|uniref:hypothetical protein n=1 Tax=Rhizobium sp. 007 TaxID=2785056 RepID=UPI0018908F8A|nr:hypothetical protein [Rhizobium sp. 007]QPB24569.1 hypothetical protein ISN39_34105 [Rhizobium sp. 007]